MQTRLWPVLSCLLGGLVWGPSFAQPVTNHCKTTPVRTNALDLPSKHAWDLFLSLNHPAVDEKIERGQADCSVSLGTPGRTALWETWRNAETEVYLADGSEPPDWNDNSLPDEAPGKVPTNANVVADVKTMSLEDRAARRADILSFHDLSSRFIGPKFSPDDGVFVGDGGFGETRMNRSTYEFIKRNCLWSSDGQQRYAAAVVDKKKPPISFPVDSIEVKAAWLDFEREGTPSEKQRTYYSAEYGGKTYGLVALHIITKDIPNWFWATFHHKDAPHNPFEIPDAHGQPKELVGTIWENYILGGTQIDFVTPAGQPTILSDHYVEFNFQRSSCITCHATASASRDGSPGPSQPMALCILNGSVPSVGLTVPACKSLIGEHHYRPDDRLWEELGTPPGSWFFKDGKPFHVQTDFVWSLPFRARRETKPPPDRCRW